MSNIKLFESKKIRTVWNESDQKWYFVIADVVEVLTESANPTDYIKKMRKRDELLSQGWGQLVTPLLLETAGGKQKLNCANAQGLLRIIQSIPSPKAEPFKLWLAKVGSERLEETHNSQLNYKMRSAVFIKNTTLHNLSRDGEIRTRGLCVPNAAR